MTEPNSLSNGQPVGSAQAVAARRQSTIPILIVVALFIGVAYYTWHTTWFGRQLNDQEIGQYLTETNKPNHVQHALSALELRIEANDPTVKQWYPKIVAQADSPQPEIRLWAAWVMGQDNKSEEFHQTLIRLLKDSYTQVRRNAAVQLVRFNDSSGKSEILSMLKPYVVQAPVAGTVTTALRNGDSVGIGVLLVSVKDDKGGVAEIRSSAQGDVRSLLKEGTQVAVGDQIMSIGPDQKSVTSALTALALIGDESDIPDIDHYLATDRNVTKSTNEQAAQTVKAIQSRQIAKPAN